MTKHHRNCTLVRNGMIVVAVVILSIVSIGSGLNTRQNIFSDPPSPTTSIIPITRNQKRDSMSRSENQEIVHVDPKGGSNIVGCSSNQNSGCKTILYSLDDLRRRGVSGVDQILVLKLQSSIDSRELANNENCRAFNFSGITFSELEITSSEGSPMLSFNCYDLMSEWVTISRFNLTLINIKWTNFRIPIVNSMESVSIEQCEIQNVTISMANIVDIHNCRVTSDGSYLSTLHLNDIYSITMSQTSFDRMTLGYVISRSSSNVYLDNISVNNGVLVFYGYVGLSELDSIKNTIFLVNSTFISSTVRIIEFNEIVMTNNVHRENIPPSMIPASVSNHFSTYTYSSLSVSCSNVRSDLEAWNILIEKMQTNGGVFIEGPGLYARFYDSIMQDNRNSLGGAAINMRTVFRVLLQNVKFFSNIVNSTTGTYGLDYIGGGAVYQYRSVLITKGCYFFNNNGAEFGGSLFSYLPLEYFSIGDSFIANIASYGGAYASMDTISVSPIYFEETIMRNNSCYKSGGAIFTMGSEVTLSYSDESSASISRNNATLLGGGIFFISSKPILKFKGLAKIFVDNLSKASLKLSDFSSFATTISTNPSSFTLEPGKEETVIFNLFDMFGNQVPYTSNIIMHASSDKSIYPQISEYSGSDDFQKRFGFSVYLTSSTKYTNNNIVNIIIGMTNIPYQKIMTFPIQLTSCGTGRMLSQSPLKTSSGVTVFGCGPNYYLIVSVAFVSGLICISICVSCCAYVGYKFFRMSGKVKLLARKEQAEEELTKKLMDLQTLYNSELENKHSYKEWLIKLEDVELVKKVGEGGGGIVYLANWKKVPVALKTIKLEDEDLDSNDFEHEASLLSSIRHPNIVTFYGVCLSESAKFMVTEFMHGGSLDSFIYALKSSKKKISFSQKIQILSNIASGMTYLHDRCIMHRDLKPGNILLSNDLTAKITDFGLSKLYSTDSGSMTKTCTVGTLLYMAPEVLLGTNYDEKCDIYSFSIIMWQVLFEESSLFNSSYVDDPKYSVIMTETQKSAFKNLNEAYMIVPKMVTEGLRLPLPSLPLSEKYVDYWIHADCGDRKLTSNLRTNYSIALDGIFRLIEECWNANVGQRPAFTKIVDKLVEIEKSVQTL